MDSKLNYYTVLVSLFQYDFISEVEKKVATVLALECQTLFLQQIEKVVMLLKEIVNNVLHKS